MAHPKLSNEIAQAYLGMLEVRTPDQYDHGRAVHDMARAVAKALKPPLHTPLPNATIDLISIAALLHDIGKTATPQSILDLPQALTQDEWTVVQAHPLIGELMLQRTKLPIEISHWVRYHHEHWDGTGYPDGLQGTQIPLGSRIIAVADAYDAMISNRSYRSAMQTTVALATIQAGAGAEWDPVCVQALTKVLTLGARPQNADIYRDRY